VRPHGKVTVDIDTNPVNQTTSGRRRAAVRYIGMTSYVVLLHRADVLPPCLSSRSSAARAVTALGAGTTQLKIEQLRHRQLPPAAAIGYLLRRSAAAACSRQRGVE